MKVKSPPASSEKVSRTMKKIKSQGTKLEEAMEKLLKKEGIAYVKQPKMFGKPDFLLSGTRVLIFCDSSFWHGRRRKELSGEVFLSNRDFWTTKLKRNKRRDRMVNSKLKKEGWTVCRFWDTDIMKRPETVLAIVRRAIDGKKGT